MTFCDYRPAKAILDENDRWGVWSAADAYVSGPTSRRSRPQEPPPHQEYTAATAQAAPPDRLPMLHADAVVGEITRKGQRARIVKASYY